MLDSEQGSTEPASDWGQAEVNLWLNWNMVPRVRTLHILHVCTCVCMYVFMFYTVYVHAEPAFWCLNNDRWCVYNPCVNPFWFVFTVVIAQVLCVCGSVRNGFRTWAKPLQQPENEMESGVSEDTAAPPPPPSAAITQLFGVHSNPQMKSTYVAMHRAAATARLNVWDDDDHPVRRKRAKCNRAAHLLKSLRG